MQPTLSAAEFPPLSGNAPKQLMLFLHGYGADGNDLIGLAPAFARHFPDAHFLSPNAPEACEMNPGGRQWFSLRDWSPANLLMGIKAVAPLLNHYIDEQLKRLGLEDKHLVLIGFSQGTMLSLHVALHRPNPCAAVVGFSGALIADDPVTSKPPVCLIHGEQDMVVPYQAMQQAETYLKAKAIAVESYSRPRLGHGIDEEGIAIATAFLKTPLLKVNAV